MNRRRFVIRTAAVAGGLAVGGGYLLRPGRHPLRATLGPGQVALTPYVIVDTSGITVITPRAEMGQGIHTTLATLVTEELDVPLSDVKVEHGPPSDVYSNTVLYPGSESGPPGLFDRVQQRLGLPADAPAANQLTGGQSSIRDAFVKMRKAGAAARTVLIEAAARELGVDPSILRTEDGMVVHPDGRTIPYTRLAAAAAAIDPPQSPQIRPRSQWSQLGTSQPRVDMVSKCTGTATYAIDVRLPGMLYGVVRRNPAIGGRMNGFDSSQAESMPGVRNVIPLDDGVVVVATHTWYAMQAVQAIEEMSGRSVYLDLRVKVLAGWRNDPEKIRQFDLVSGTS